MDIEKKEFIDRLYAIYEAAGDFRGLERLRIAVEVAQWEGFNR